MPSACAIFASNFFLAYAGFGPVTLEFEREQWENRLLSAAEISRVMLHSTLAIRGDGSRSVRHQGQAFRNYFRREQSAVAAAFFDATQHLAVRLDLVKLLAFAGPSHCQLPLLRQPTPKDCVLNDPFGATRLPDATHLGLRVAVWRRHGGTEQWLAPQLNCAVVREVTVEFGDWRIPLRYERRELKRLHFGEPDPQLFAIPPSFRVVP